MANGGDPNSVESQQVTQTADAPVAETADEKLIKERKKAEQTRKIQALQLNRARICEQLGRTTNERYKVMLNTELQSIDSELTKLG